jgi:hypothetical protein
MELSFSRLARGGWRVASLRSSQSRENNGFDDL